MPGTPPPDLTTAERDELLAAVDAGVLRINTCRKILGLDPWDIPEADMLLDVARLARSERLARVALTGQAIPDMEAVLLAPLTFDAFQAEWTAACGTAWDADFGEPALVLPGFLWPRLAELANPVTGVSVVIQRVNPFPVPAPAAAPAGGGLADIG